MILLAKQYGHSHTHALTPSDELVGRNIEGLAPVNYGWTG